MILSMIRMKAASASHHNRLDEITQSLVAFAGRRRFSTFLADPWRFTNRTGKMAPYSFGTAALAAGLAAKI
jgi:hypothetical protein